MATTTVRYLPLNLCSALFVSLLIHILALVATSSAAPPLLHLPAGRLRIVVNLPARHQIDISERHSPVAPPQAVSAPISAPALSPSDSSPLTPESSRLSPPIPLAAYYRRSELTIPAIPLSEPYDLPQPLEQLSGRAELTLLVGEDGAVDTVITKESTFPPEYYNQLEVFFSKMKFQPGMVDGRPEKSRFEIEVSTTYKPEIIESRTLVEEPPRP